MSKWLITIDFDNILADTAGAFVDWYNNKYTTQVKITDIEHPLLQDNDCFPAIHWLPAGSFYKEFITKIHSENSIKPILWSKNWIINLHNMWYDLSIVTWRTQELAPITMWRAIEYFWDFFVDIYCANDHTSQTRTKWEICFELWSILHIDDFVHYAQSVVQHGIPAILLHMPWNQWDLGESLIHRVMSWDDITTDLVTKLIDAHTS